MCARLGSLASQPDDGSAFRHGDRVRRNSERTASPADRYHCGPFCGMSDGKPKLTLPGPGSVKTLAGEGEPSTTSLWQKFAPASGKTRELFPHAPIGSYAGITASSCLGWFLKALA